MQKCDLCNEVRDCVPKVIGDKEYDICLECWKALEEKLIGKGKGNQNRGTGNIIA